MDERERGVYAITVSALLGLLGNFFVSFLLEHINKSWYLGFAIITGLCFVLVLVVGLWLVRAHRQEAAQVNPAE